MKKKIKQIIELNKKRTKGKWEFCYSYHLDKYSSLQNDKEEIILQACGINDGDTGLHWLDENMKKSDMILIEKIPAMINIILKLKKENKKLMSSIRLNDESFRIQKILLENATFFKAVENALTHGWSSNEKEKEIWFKALFNAKDGNEDALVELKSEFKFNNAFKKETGAFQNV